MPGNAGRSLLELHAGGELNADFGNWYVPTVEALVRARACRGFLECVEVVRGPTPAVPALSRGAGAPFAHAPERPAAIPPPRTTAPSSTPIQSDRYYADSLVGLGEEVFGGLAHLPVTIGQCGIVAGPRPRLPRTPRARALLAGARPACRRRPRDDGSVLGSPRAPSAATAASRDQGSACAVAARPSADDRAPAARGCSPSANAAASATSGSSSCEERDQRSCRRGCGRAGASSAARVDERRLRDRRPRPRHVARDTTQPSSLGACGGDRDLTSAPERGRTHAQRRGRQRTSSSSSSVFAVTWRRRGRATRRATARSLEPVESSSQRYASCGRPESRYRRLGPVPMPMHTR